MFEADLPEFTQEELLANKAEEPAAGESSAPAAGAGGEGSASAAGASGGQPEAGGVRCQPEVPRARGNLYPLPSLIPPSLREWSDDDFG